ncbi:MAG: universal stress protein [Gemmatimonadota bacterium]
MYGDVMVPLDGSTFSEHALPLAAAIARRAGATLHLALVHTPLSVEAPDAVPFRLLTEWEGQNREREATYLARRAKEVEDAGVPVRSHLRDGDVGEELTALAREADLVVLASHGRGGIERAWLGSVADELIRHIRPPVLVVRPSQDEAQLASLDAPATGLESELDLDPAHRIRHIMAATGGSEAAEAAVDHAIQLARLCDARVTLLGVADVPGGLSSPYIPHAALMDRAMTQNRQAESHRQLRILANRYDDVPIAARVWRAFHPARGILDAIAQLEPDLVVVGTHRRTVLGRAVLGSVADKVVRASPVPVLVGHVPAEVPNSAAIHA